MKRKKMLVTLLATALVIAAVVSQSYAATPENIEAAIERGVAYLAGAQKSDGHWPAYAGGGDWFPTSMTCIALLKLQDRAYELDFDSPFDPNYEYHTHVEKGWEWLLSATSPRPRKKTLSLQDHTALPHGSGTLDDPDTNGNGYGLEWGSHELYETGICLMALSATGEPDRPTDGGWDANGDGNPDTYLEITQDTVDYVAWAQVDTGGGEGGWWYDPANNSGPPGDQSVSGHVVVGLSGARPFGATVPVWVDAELDLYIDFIQCSDGGSGYWGCPGSNLYRTGHLLQEMGFVGDAPTAARFEKALKYIEANWGQAANNYQTMWSVMKGLEYNGIDLIALDGDGVRDDDWFNQEPPGQDLASALVAQQNLDGSWPRRCNGYEVLCTSYALLTLERVAPPPPVIEIEVSVDIKPGSCPNPFNPKSKGVLPVAILGSEEFDVTTIDPATVKLTREEYEAGVSPLRWSYEDVGTPFEGELCDCHDLNGDGLLDLTLKFDTQEVNGTLELADEAGNTIPLLVTGNLTEEAGGTPIEGSDCVRVWKKKK